MPSKMGFHIDPPPITVAVRSIKCIEETDEVGSDEPYVIVVAANLTGTPPGVEATRYGPWDDVDKGELHETVPLPLPPGFPEFLMNIGHITRRPFWGLDNKTAQKIRHTKDVIFLVAVLENDDGEPDAARVLAKEAVLGSLVASMASPRPIRVQKAIHDMNAALVLPTGGPSFDEHIDSTKELDLTATDLLRPILGPHSRELSFAGDGGHYTVEFVFTKA
jgi:hypothetical protein